MNKVLIGMVCGLCLIMAGSLAMAQTIDEIQVYTELGAPDSPYDTQILSATGTIYVIADTYNPGTIYIVDGTGNGITAYNQAFTGLVVGTSVTIQGTVGTYSGEIQLASPTLTSNHGFVGVPTPIAMTVSEVLNGVGGETGYENVGKFVSVIGKVTEVNASNFFLTTDPPSTDIIQVYIDIDTEISLGNVQVDDIYQVLSPVVVYNTEIELKPRKQGDLIENPGGDTVPVIDNVVCDNYVPETADPVLVSASITDDGTVVSASLHYRYSDGVTPGSWETPVGMVQGVGDTWSATIPGSHPERLIEYYISATDDFPQIVTQPGDAPLSYYTLAVGFTSIYDMQYADPEGEVGTAAMIGQYLNIRGVVTAGTGQAGSTTKFILQEVDPNPETGDYSFGAVLVYESSALYDYYTGDYVEIGGLCDEYYGLTEMIPHHGEAVVWDGGYADVPPATRMPTEVFADFTPPIGDGVEVIGDGDPITGEAWESVWVQTYPALVSKVGLYGEYNIRDNAAVADTLIVDPIVTLTYAPTLGDVLTVEGFMDYSYSRYRLVPTADEFIIDTELSAVPEAELTATGGFKSIAPNPFNPATKISFVVGQDNPVQLNVYNLRGEKVRTLLQEALPANEYDVIWDGTNDKGQMLPSGPYFARLRIGRELMQVKDMMLLK